jgi:streptomycin 6-kinase
VTLTAEQWAALDEWGVDRLEPVDSYSWVWWARQADQHVMVKAGDAVARSREGWALTSFRGGAARLCNQDHALGLIVVERILPGDDIRPLSRVDDDAATQEIAQLAARLHSQQTAVAELPHLREIGIAFEGTSDPRLPASLVAAARRMFEELVESPGPEVTLHGDLHHMNVLRGTAGWMAIDPHGWVGDPAFEAAPMLANPRAMIEEGGDARGMDGRDLARRVIRRAEVYSEVAGLDSARVRAWALVGCVIAELWMLEGHNMIHGAPLAVAEALLAEGHS